MYFYLTFFFFLINTNTTITEIQPICVCEHLKRIIKQFKNMFSFVLFKQQKITKT